MSDNESDQRGYAFGHFVLDIGRGVLLREGHDLELQHEAFAVLRYLVERNGSIVEQRELLELLGSSSDDAEAHVAGRLAEIRAAIGDANGEMIRDVSGGGYLFDMRLEPLAETATPDMEAVDRDDPSRPERGGRIASLVALVLISLIWTVLAVLVGR